ncbi:glycosyltransferase family 4 protein [Psychrobacter faecalis]|uniref:glycosyltransferase family 4 protein n=1 Tax=Psychrobacter faecalis TaxID=180588 RepID=UPI003FD2BFDD
MKALFIHDHPFYNLNGEFYSPGSFTASTWSRYLNTEMLSELTVVARGIKISNTNKGLIKSFVDKVQFDLLYHVKGGIDYYRYASDIKSQLRKHIEKVDIVIIRAPSAFGAHAYQICRQLNKPYITEVVACPLDSYWNYGNILGKLHAPLSYIQNKRLIKNSLATLYVTEKFLQKRYPTEASITTCASNVHIPSPEITVLNKHLERLESISSSHVFKLGILANIAVKYKGYDVAIEALHILKARRPELRFRFLIAGGGSSEYVSSLITQYSLKDEVKLLGQLASGDEVFNYLDNLDVYLQPSLTEGLPRSVIEAMSRGCPVLASSAGGIPELLDDSFLHKSGDANKLSFDIERFLIDPQLRIKAAKENFEKSKEYTDEILSQRRLSFYKQAFDLAKDKK